MPTFYARRSTSHCPPGPPKGHGERWGSTHYSTVPGTVLVTLLYPRTRSGRSAPPVIRMIRHCNLRKCFVNFHTTHHPNPLITISAHFFLSSFVRSFDNFQPTISKSSPPVMLPALHCLGSAGGVADRPRHSHSHSHLSAAARGLLPAWNFACVHSLSFPVPSRTCPPHLVHLQHYSTLEGIPRIIRFFLLTSRRRTLSCCLLTITTA